MRWDDIDDCEGCRKERLIGRTALVRLADKLGGPKESSALTRLARTLVTVPPHTRTVDGHVEHVSGYTYYREGGALDALTGGRPSAPSAPSAPRQQINTPTPAATLKGKAAKKAGKKAWRQKANVPKGESLARTPAQNLPQIEGVELRVKTGDGTEKNPFVTDDVETAAALIMHRGEEGAAKEGYYVQLNQERKVSTLLDRVKMLVDDAIEKAGGDKSKAPTYDLCKVSVPGTNLFCVDNKNIARVDMPQLTTDHPIAGSPADKLERDEMGEVNLSELYAKHLRDDLGINVEVEDVDPSFLRATQRELNGWKVAKLAGKIAEGGYQRDKPIFVTRDDYVVDGHHRWAGAIGAEYKTGVDLQIPVQRIDADIMTIYRDAMKWTAEMGVPSEAAAGAAQSPTEAVKK